MAILATPPRPNTLPGENEITPEKMKQSCMEPDKNPLQPRVLKFDLDYGNERETETQDRNEFEEERGLTSWAIDPWIMGHQDEILSNVVSERLSVLLVFFIFKPLSLTLLRP